ncbi:MAG: peptide ABC transporter substrate-binding protein [Simkaniaceae bacterium]|nr:MAG: peptide ABC transporter substrate-binding protein [Simkaniaceae bacterium]
MPAVAHTVDISDDGKIYTFHLKDTTWSDGAPVTAYDFEYAWKMLINPQSKSITALPELFYPIKNAEKFLLGNCSSENVGITVLDDKTLSVELEYPAQYFLEIVSSPFLYPAPRHVVESDPRWCTKPGFVCNGPFMLSKWRINSEIELVKNPRYWDQEHVYLDGIDLLICQNHQTALDLFENGTLDWVGDPFMRISYDCSYRTLKEKAPDSMLYFFVFNTDKYPFNNSKLRKALSYAIDRDGIVENVFHDTAEPALSALPFPLRLKGGPYFQDNNPDLAKDLLQEALDEMGETIESLPQIELLYMPEVEFAKKICLAVQDQWRTNLGFKISLRGLFGWNEYIDSIQQGDYMIAITGAIPPISDPSFVLQIFKNKKDLCNRCNWENEKFKDLLLQANYVLGKTERSKLLMEAEKVLMDEMPILPICSMNKSYAKNPKLKGERLSQLQFVDFKSAYFEDDQ